MSAVSVSTRKKNPAQALIQQTDITGHLEFANVPINNYLIRVEESKNFLGNEKMLNLIAERTIQPRFEVFIEIKPQTSSFVEVAVKNEENIELEEASVTALLLTSFEVDSDSITYFNYVF